MDNVVLYKLVEEARLQSRFAQIAFQNLKSSLRQLDQEQVFFYLHALLAHATNASRLFWPARQSSLQRGEQLRNELKINEDSGLKLQGFRGQVDHHDERLEDWILSLENRNYIDMNIMPQGTMTEFRQDKFHRNLDPETLIFCYRGDLCDLRRINSELQKIESGCQIWLRTHNPW